MKNIKKWDKESYNDGYDDCELKYKLKVDELRKEMKELFDILISSQDKGCKKCIKNIVKTYDRCIIKKFGCEKS